MTIKEAHKIRMFLESVERIITLLMNQSRQRISTQVRIFDENIVFFVAEKNIGVSGYSPGYELFILKPENIPFTHPSGISVKSIRPVQDATHFENFHFQRINIEIPPENKKLDEILSFATSEVVRLFGDVEDMFQENKWDYLQAVPEIRYLLQPIERGPASGPW